MICVKSIDRETIDSWPIAASGLPQRVVNSSKFANIRTIGELRKLTDKELRVLPGLGAGSIAHIHHFFRICNEIESGNKRFANLKTIFDFFLNPIQYDILVLRYGLQREEMIPSRTYATLQAIGNKHHICRERVRQMEEKGKEALSSRLAQICLGEIYNYFENLIKKNHYVATPGEVATLQTLQGLDGYNPCSVLLLLCDCSRNLLYHNGFFTTLSLHNIIEIIEGQAMEFLRANQTPQPLPKILEALANIPIPANSNLDRGASAARQKIIRCVLSHFPYISATKDDRYFIPETGAPYIVMEIMRCLPAPIHFRLVMQEFNRLMHHGSRKGAGHILNVLQENPQFARTSSGYYKISSSAADDRRRM